jgi:hypothetical protein
MQSIDLENFRGIRALKLDPLRRITLIGGLNGTGKTTILDAAFQFMDSGNPLLLLRSGNFKQTPVSLPSIHRINEGNKPDHPGKHRFRTRQGNYETLWTWGVQDMGPIDTKEIAVSNDLASQSKNHQLGYHQVVTHDGVEVLSRHYAGEGVEGIMFRADSGDTLAFPAASYLSRLTLFNATDFANRYSQVVQNGLKRRFIEVVNTLSLQFSDAEILHVANQPVLHLSIGDVILPLAYAGDGIATVAAIALAIMNSRGGMILVDEFDASIHYSRMEEVWKLFHALAVEFDVQVIAATHSRESATSLFNAVEESHKNDVIYYRLDLVEGKNIATSYSWEEIKEADFEGWEFR